MTTRATSDPVIRVVRTKGGEDLVAEIREDTLTLRPVGSKAAATIISVDWGRIYYRAMLEQTQVVTPRKRHSLQ